MKLYKRSHLLRSITVFGLASSITAGSVIQPVYGSEQMGEVISQDLQSDSLMEIIPWDSETQTLQDKSEFKILSDLDYVEDQLYIGYGEFAKDARPGGGVITLLVDGKPLQFVKGIGAHAHSRVVYDLSDYPEYTRFTTYAGVDYTAEDRGNGVIFTIQASHDGNTWVDLDKSPVQKGTKEAYYFDVEVAGYKYLRLYADHNGNDGSDHSVYAYPTLMREDYYTSTTQNLPFKSVEDYDQEIKATGEGNSVTNQHLLNQRTFVSKIGYNQLKTSVQMDPKVGDVIKWLFNDEEALEYFITGGAPVHSYGVSLKVLADLKGAIGQDFSDPVEGDLYIKLAMSTALTATDYKTDRIERYEVFKRLYNEDKLMNRSQFRSIPIETLRLVVGNDNDRSWVKSDSQHVYWINDFIRGFNPNAPIGSLDPYAYISYRNGYNHGDSQYYSPANYDKWNQKYKLAEYGIPYGKTGYIPQWVIFEEGAVCGGIAGGGVGLNTSVGIPTVFVGQPGHAAYLVYSQNEKGQGIWSIGNDISGFSETSKGGRLPLGWGSESWSKGYEGNYFLISQHALNTYDTYIEALHLLDLADVYRDDLSKQEALYRKVLILQPYNLDAMIGLLNTYSAQGNKTSGDYLELAETFGDALTYFPQVMVDMLNHIRQDITDPKDLYAIDMLISKNLIVATQADATMSLQAGDCRAVANYLLSQYKFDFATFSFTGEQAGHIIINQKYSNKGLKIKYSLDGGDSWFETTDTIISLSQEEIKSLSVETDILVGVVGASPIVTIDIVEGPSLEHKRIYQNEWENQLIGDVLGLEYSLDSGQTWADYVLGVNGTRFDGAGQEVMVRSKMQGTQLAGVSKVYTFAADESVETNQYITIDRLSVVDYSSQQDEGMSAAANVIDGSIYSSWHTVYSQTDTEKYVTIEVDEPTRISQIQYVPREDAGNGTFTKTNIFVSMDNENWTTIATGIEWPRNNELKTYTFETPVMAKYVKIQAESGHNNFATALIFNLYEDVSSPISENHKMLQKMLIETDLIIEGGKQNYSTLAWDNLVEIRDIGYEVLGDKYAPETEFVSMILHIKEAISYLYNSALSDLKALIQQVERLEETEYTIESWNELLVELEAARDVAQSPADANTQASIGRLKEALEALQVKTPEVEDKAPQIVGVENVWVQYGEDFNPLKGITAYDQEDGDLTSKLKVSWGGDITAVGEHELTYHVVDSAGNEAYATCIVTVTPISEPEIPEPEIPEPERPEGDTYDADRAYVAGETVIYKGQEYVAKWWVQGEAPDSSQAWELQAPINPDGSSEYVPGKAYVGGDIVSYKGELYEAKWWTISIPGSDDSWMIIDTI
ncbi:MAG: discoidin domain-containing protein [Cellulosilyticaceae bacterium]